MTELLAITGSLSIEDEVELYQLDLNPIGFAVVHYFTPSSQSGASLWHDGNEYVPRPIQVKGFGKSSGESPPEPTIVMSNIDAGGTALVQEYDDLLGVKITRLITFGQFLDKLPNGDVNPNADPFATQIPEIWYIDQKTGDTPEAITWRLASALDLNGKKVPARLVLKDICLRTYRNWNGASFDYPLKNACPYADSTYFDKAGDVTVNPALDECTKDAVACKLRFPSEPLPGWFFPGVTRLPR